MTDEHVEVDWNMAPPAVRAWFQQQLELQREARAAEEARLNPPRRDAYERGPATWDLTPGPDGRRTVPPELDPNQARNALARLRTPR